MFIPFCVYRFRRRISEVSYYAQPAKHNRPDSRTDAKFSATVQSGAELRADSGTERLANGPVNSGQTHYRWWWWCNATCNPR